MESMALLLIVAFVCVIALGFITKINTGYWALAFAYVIGCFFMNMRPGAIVALWPMNIFFVLFSVSLFYNFPIQNGTLEKIALAILKKFEKTARLLPFVFFFASALTSLVGAGFFSVMALMCPMAFLVCRKANISLVLGGVAVMLGSLAGSGFITSPTGILAMNLIASSGFQEVATEYALYKFAFCFVLELLLLTVFYIAMKGYSISAEGLDITIEPYTREQKLSLILIGVFIAVMVLPFLLSTLLPKVTAFATLRRYIDVSFVSIILAIAAMFLKLGDPKKALAKVPWDTIIMISGVGILVGLAVKAGTIKMLTQMVSATSNAYLVTLFTGLIASTMSLFSSTSGVVYPTLYPVVGGIAEASGISAAFLISVISVCSGLSGFSPFSSGGSIMLGTLTSEEEARMMYPKLLILPFVCVAITLVFIGILVPFLS